MQPLRSRLLDQAWRLRALAAGPTLAAQVCATQFVQAEAGCCEKFEFEPAAVPGDAPPVSAPLKGLWLQGPGLAFDDDFIDLMPGSEHRVRVHGDVRAPVTADALNQPTLLKPAASTSEHHPAHAPARCWRPRPTEAQPQEKETT